MDESKYKDEEGNADLTAYQAALQAKKDLVLDGVLAVLDLDREALADRLERTYSQYEVLKTNIEKEQAEQLRAFITENKLSHFLYLTPTTKRYYPYGDLAAHVLGFCNSEGGAYGVEAIYNDVLEGTVGRVVTTRTGTGVEMYDSYSEYVDAEDGCDLTLTIDTTIQSYAERILEEGSRPMTSSGAAGALCWTPRPGLCWPWPAPRTTTPTSTGPSGTRVCGPRWRLMCRPSWRSGRAKRRRARPTRRSTRRR